MLFVLGFLIGTAAGCLLTAGIFLSILSGAGRHINFR
jgi:hypothetical protein